MRVLALEAYYGGSHRAFLDGWSARSRHEWTILTLPPFKWKWRMRHASVTFAEQVAQLAANGSRWDIIFCSDMLSLASFRGLAPAGVRDLPAIVYFHENQLTYPVRCESERDYHFVMTNLTSALAASQVWFNSKYHRDSFLDAMPGFLSRMPDYQPTDAIEVIRDKSHIASPGVEMIGRRTTRLPGPTRILWAARWEHDKNPEAFFEALKQIKSQGIDFRVSAIGEQFRDRPTVFEWAREHFNDQIDRWGYQETYADYEAALRDADIFVSTADHEFFGISAVEAISAGAFPLLPERLAYPEVLGQGVDANVSDFFYPGDSQSLATRLADLIGRAAADELWQNDPDRAIRAVNQFSWARRASEMDVDLERAARA